MVKCIGRDLVGPVWKGANTVSPAIGATSARPRAPRRWVLRSGFCHPLILPPPKKFGRAGRTVPPSRYFESLDRSGLDLSTPSGRGILALLSGLAERSARASCDAPTRAALWRPSSAAPSRGAGPSSSPSPTTINNAKPSPVSKPAKAAADRQDLPGPPCNLSRGWRGRRWWLRSHARARTRVHHGYLGRGCLACRHGPPVLAHPNKPAMVRQPLQ